VKTQIGNRLNHLCLGIGTSGIGFVLRPADVFTKAQRQRHDVFCAKAQRQRHDVGHSVIATGTDIWTPDEKLPKPHSSHHL